MSKNRGVVYIKPGVVEVKDIADPKFEDPRSRKINHVSQAIIHNSNYPSVDAAKSAIDKYFCKRNEHFRIYPKRAGNKIWGDELVLSQFSPSHNCKHPRFMRLASIR